MILHKREWRLLLVALPAPPSTSVKVHSFHGYDYFLYNILKRCRVFRSLNTISLKPGMASRLCLTAINLSHPRHDK